MKQVVPRGTSGRTARSVAVAAAIGAGAVVRHHYGRASNVRYKGKGNLVTQADLDSERTILDVLHREFPEHGIVSEERSPKFAGSSCVWYVDPLDGTTNFAFGLPCFAVSVALVDNGEPLLAVIYDPLRRELFVAQRGHGATLNGQRIYASSKDGHETVMAAFDLGYDEQARQHAMAVAAKLRPEVMSLRLIGSAVLGQAYVACGRFDLYFHRFLYPWDVAAGQLLVREAGAFACDWSGEPATIESRTLIAANANLTRLVCSLPEPSAV